MLKWQFKRKVRGKMYVPLLAAEWILLTFAVRPIMADSDADQHKYDQNVVIGATIGATFTIVIFILSVWYFCYRRDVNKIRTRARMRELINCKYRSKMIITPEPSLSIDQYFVKQGLDTESLFNFTVDTGEDIKREKEKRQNFDLEMMFMTEKERERMSDILDGPDKVKQLYEDKEIVSDDDKGNYNSRVEEDKCGTLFAQDEMKCLYEEKEMEAYDDSGNNYTFLEVNQSNGDTKENINALGYDTDVSCGELDVDKKTNAFQEIGIHDLDRSNLSAKRLVSKERNEHIDEFDEEKYRSIEMKGGNGIIDNGESHKVKNGEVMENIPRKDKAESYLKENDKIEQSKLVEVSEIGRFDQETNEDGDDDDYVTKDRLQEISRLDLNDIKDISINASPESNDSCQRKTPFLSLPEIDQFFESSNPILKHKKKKKSFKKESRNTQKHFTTFSRAKYPLAIAIDKKDFMKKNKQHKSKSDIEKELKLFSAQVLLTERLKRQKLLYSRISLPNKHHLDKDVHVAKRENRKQMHSLQKTPRTSKKYGSKSRASEYESVKSPTSVSVSNIGFDLR